MSKSFIHLNSEDHWQQTRNFMKNRIKNRGNFILTTKDDTHTSDTQRTKKKYHTSLYNGPQISQNSRETPQNSRHQTAHLNHNPFSELTSTRRHHTQFSCPGDLAPWVCARPIHNHVRSCLCCAF